MLQIHRINILICNGIKASYLDMLKASDISVIPKVSLTIIEALNQFTTNKLQVSNNDKNELTDTSCVPHQELVEWAGSIFKKHGFDVTEGPGEDAFLIDLVCEISCPQCKRPIKVAVCCGSHTYRTELEIAEFHRATSSGYNARVFVCTSQPAIVTCCKEYYIQLIDPEMDTALDHDSKDATIPLLKGPIMDHKLSCLDYKG